MKKDMEIIDNFLGLEEFDELQTFMMGDQLPWYFNDLIVNDKEGPNKFQFTHTFYKAHQPHSEYCVNLNPITIKLNSCAVIRIKANLLTRTRENEINQFHVDMDNIESLCTTSIFYVNTNNGYTIFEDGTKVESVANRMIIFPGNMSHAGTTCTDEKRRIIINFNYFLV